ncbi:acetyl-CoA synthetase-like protein [Aspergillus pseudonomiae]|uniref:Acetyl-CoA synthetase-like protein n=1 Tax=Aspergillus pseudonomiae TaxID=1506151 RepID=A0A5N6HU89_9EURO|nr:acetyl-CoA synthetase-like protein [Aspergillus pseudonomiae]KAB8257986.1 acetyl-CoA synthetase-like protein [Aspergillus pseudonomiae]KAE8397769.1 acetyl-CoA synthetase-like protein [Aspergillus pseudonomiae]
MAENFWQQTFADLQTSPYPVFPVVGYKPCIGTVIDHEIDQIDFGTNHDQPYTLSTTVYAAWALLLAQYANTSDVVFGTRVDGLRNDLSCSEDVQQGQDALPLRVPVNWECDLDDWLQANQDRIAAMQETDTPRTLDQIRACSQQTREACEFRTSLIVRDTEPEVYEGTHPFSIERALHTDFLALIVEFFPSTHRRTLLLRFHIDEAVLDTYQTERMVLQLTHLIRQLCNPALSRQKRVVGDLDILCDEDKALIWKWNGNIPRMANTCVTDLFAYQVQRRGDHPAVHAWDGCLTYAELDERSTRLAGWLCESKIAGPGHIVPICFDKTLWTTITLLAIAKAGSTFIMLDPYQPLGRLKSIMEQIQSPTILARHDTVRLAQSLADNAVIVDDELLRSRHEIPSSLHKTPIAPSDHLYIVFTSGSTGTPKGVIISHANLCTAVGHQARALGFNTGVRTFDSSSYSFDAYVCNTFHTLLTGGCLCVPSESDRMNNLQSVLQAMEVEFAQLTPSTSRLLDPGNLPHLRTLVLTGEKINRTVLEPWLATAGRVRVINVYGPSECTIMCAGNRNIKCLKDAESVGFGLGANLWIADVNNIHRLAPIGAIGELLIDGPIIGQGYLGDAQKTRESLVQIHGGYLPGITLAPDRPVFRTQDLARYNVDGSITFIGRADTQIKINGQRVEIGEVEYHLGQCLPEGMNAVVEAVEWPSGQKQLLAFIHLQEEKKQQLVQWIPMWDDQLADRLPRFMIPSAYVPVSSIPMTATGKTDRRVLRQMALGAPDQLLSVHNLPELVAGEASVKDTNRPLTKVEMILGWLWVEVLNLDKDTALAPGDNFFARGGDSLAAMRLVRALHSEGCSSIKVADIFRHPRLCDIAVEMEKGESRPSNATPSPASPFSLLLGTAQDPQIMGRVRLEICQLCGCEPFEIEDIFPCSPIQEEMVILGARNPQDFVTQTVFSLPQGVDINRFRRAWETVTMSAPIIRTRIVDTKKTIVGDTAVKYDHAFSQVVVSGQVPWTQYSDLNQCLQDERGRGTGLGEALLRFAVVDEPKSDEKQLSPLKAVLTMHHAIYDGWSMDLLGRSLAREYYGLGDHKVPDDGLLPYRNFIQYLSTSDAIEASRFWSRYLKDVHLRPFPALPAPDYRPYATALQEHSVSGLKWKRASGITANTIVQTAWGMVLSKYSGSSEVVFGTTLLGRQIPLVGIERVVGPTIATVPVRVVIDWDDQSSLDLLQTMQEDAADIIPFMHYGIKRIRQLGNDMRQACDFQAFLVVQPVPQPRYSGTEKALFDLGDGQDDIQAFNTYAIMVDCELTSDGFHLRASFDENLLGKYIVRQMLQDMEHVVLSLITATEKPVMLREMDIVTDEERKEIRKFKEQDHNAQMLEIESSIKACIPDNILDTAVEIIELPGLSKQLVALVSPIQTEIHSSRLNAMLANVIQLLNDRLPAHMIPSKFLPLPRIPKLASGFVDREELRHITQSTPTVQLVDSFSLLRVSHDEPPGSPGEVLLQSLWASILAVDRSLISRRASFLALGGDSLAAMRLVAAAQEEGFSLTVAEVLRTPRLADMADRALRPLAETPTMLPKQVEPFSLLGNGLNKELLAKICHLQPGDIEDAYPCSPIQGMMLVHSARRPGEFVSQGHIHLPAHVDVARLKAAWYEVISATSILRTRIVEFAEQGLLQVVTNTAPIWIECDSLGKVPSPPVGLGDPLLRFALIKPQPSPGTNDDGSATLIMTIHHAIYDRWSASLVTKMVESIYRGEARMQQLVPYSRFIQYLERQVDAERGLQFWETYLSDCIAPQFPALPNPKYQPTTTSTRKRSISSLKWPNNFTPTTTLRASWAILVSQYCNSSDISFGSVVMGRQAPLPGVERIAGPTIATVPIRVEVNWASSTLHTLLQGIQSSTTDMIPFEHYGIGRIQRLNSMAQQACQFQSLMVVQPAEDVDTDGNTILRLQLGDDDFKGGTYALILQCVLDGPLASSSNNVSVTLSFDEHVIDPSQAERMLVQFEQALREVCRHDDVIDKIYLSQLQLLSRSDSQQIWSWNAMVPEKVDGRVDRLIAERVEAQPDAPAICAWDGELSYREVFSKARLLAYWLVIHQGVGPEVLVPICCTKSLWTPVAILAVIMAGGVVVTMDPFQAVERLRAITSQLNPRLILASPATQAIAQQLSAATVHVVDEQMLQGILDPDLAEDGSWIPVLSGDNALYVTFTSGSTGTPKGAVITHANVCSAMVHLGPYTGLNETDRILDLASYSFDMAWYVFLHTFYAGGCLCVPSEDDRRNNIPRAIHSLRVNHLDTTPSLARTLDPKSLPMIKKIALGGEALQMDDITRWGSDVEIRNSYGPSECTMSSTLSRYGEDFTTTVNIGPPRGLNAWVTSCLQPNRLVPIGAIGELVLEGPLVGRGYLNNPAKTASAFISNPAWLRDGNGVLVSRPQSRFYRTGDLVTCDSEGRLTYVARVDTQVKLRGQRLELEEVEYHARRLLDTLPYTVAAEVVEISTLQNPDQKSQRLMMFFSTTEKNDGNQGSSPVEPVPLSSVIANDLTRRLTEILPRYMVPTEFILLPQIPLSSAGKVDRKKLRIIGARIHWDARTQKGPIAEPQTECERALRVLWSDVLKISTDLISRQDSFFELGGDSLTAIRLVGAARAKDLPLSVATIFQYPRLDEMACQIALMTEDNVQASSYLSPLALDLPDVSEIAKALSTTDKMIADILPVTDFQRYTIRCALQSPRTEWNYFTMSFKGLSVTTKLKNVCQQLVSSIEILRCVFLPHNGDGDYLQVVLRSFDPDIAVHTVRDEPVDQVCEAICMNDLVMEVAPGSPFVNFFILESEQSQQTRLVIGLSHALYDGISLRHMAECISALYHDRPMPPVSDFSTFMKLSPPPAAFAHWRAQLQGAPAPTSAISNQAPATLQPGPRTQMHQTVHFSHETSKDKFTVATIFTAAWGIALARTAGLNDIVFGRGVSGRTVVPSSGDDMETVVGPCLNLAPVRIQLPEQSSPAAASKAVTDYRIVESLQSQFNQSVAYEAIGLSEIVKNCTDWPRDVSDYGSVFYFQNFENHSQIQTADHDVPLIPIKLNRADPPEPPRLNVWPRGGGEYLLELLVHEGNAAKREVWAKVLDRMVRWLADAEDFFGRERQGISI